MFSLSYIFFQKNSHMGDIGTGGTLLLNDWRTDIRHLLSGYPLAAPEARKHWPLPSEATLLSDMI